MAKYFGVKCANCGRKIPLEFREPTLQRKIVKFCYMPLHPIDCPDCGHTQQYESKDSLYFEGPDGLLLPPGL